jgi:hypothetical protein
VFRVRAKQPELWNPVDGTMLDLPEFAERESKTAVPMKFEAGQSFFVVFRKGSQKPEVGVQSGSTNFPELKELQQVSGPWTVEFAQQWFYPADGLPGDQAGGKFVFEKLEDWTTRPEDAVKYFSGTAVYRNQLRIQQPEPGAGAKMLLDLGVVREMARVRINGHDVGTVWCSPWRVDISKAVKSGENQLEIEVVNLWPNRLLGDHKLPADKRRTRTNISPRGGEGLISSGLLGPVRLLTE